MSRRVVTTVMFTVLIVSAMAPAGVAVSETPNDHESTDCAFPTTITDATGTEVSVTDRPERVVVLGASAAQTTWELGAGDRVVGIDAFSTYLDGATDVPIVSGGIGQVDYEAALNQSPDLVIVAGNSYSSDVVEEFRRSNVTTFAMPNADDIPAVYNKTQTFGRLLGSCETAHTVVSDMRDRVSTVEEAVTGEETPSVFIDFGSVRDASARYSAGPSTFVGGIVQTAGTANIVAEGEFTSPFPQVSNEFILSQNPEWLVVTYTPGSSFGPATPEEARAAARNSSVLSETAAVEEGNIIAVNANNFSQPAPRLVDALEHIAKTVHPEAYEKANQTTTTTSVTTTAATTDETTTRIETAQTPTTTSGDGGPGFGPVVAITAIALLAGGLRRRD